MTTSNMNVNHHFSTITKNKTLSKTYKQFVAMP